MQTKLEPSNLAGVKSEPKKLGWYGRICSGSLRWPILAVCVLMGFGGAVNEGFSAWAMAIPFAFPIWMVASLADRAAIMGSAKKADHTIEQAIASGSMRRASALFFFAFVAVVSWTQYRNPWIYPILDDGQVTALVDVKIGSYTSYGSSERFLDAWPDGVDADGHPKFDRGANYKELGRFSKGARFKVVGIYGDSGDLYQRVGLVLSDGKLDFHATQSQWAGPPPKAAPRTASEIAEKKADLFGQKMADLFGQKVLPSKAVQAPWAEFLGNLMNWPIFPMLAMALMAPSAPHSR